MYEIYFGNAVKKDIKNLPKNIQRKVDEVFLLLSHNPKVGEGLAGEFLGFYSYHFKNQKTEYRIIYSIKDEILTVFIIIVGTRENIYKQLKRRM